MFKHTEAEFKAFEPRLKSKTLLKYVPHISQRVGNRAKPFSHGGLLKVP